MSYKISQVFGIVGSRDSRAKPIALQSIDLGSNQDQRRNYRHQSGYMVLSTHRERNRGFFFVFNIPMADFIFSLECGFSSGASGVSVEIFSRNRSGVSMEFYKILVPSFVNILQFPVAPYEKRWYITFPRPFDLLVELFRVITYPKRLVTLNFKVIISFADVYMVL